MKKSIVGVLVFLFISILAYLLYKESQILQSYGVNSWTEDQSADCAVVLTGGAHRIREGFDLLNQNRIKKLIISGVHPHAQLQDIFPLMDFYSQVDPENVVLERNSQTTYGNAKQSLQIIEALHCRDIILVTSRLHMHRALQVFKASFSKDFPIYPRAVLWKEYHHNFMDLFTESVKSLFYSLWAFDEEKD